jgi:2',3'-cyclic-nucleotide 2'-phosphodiesterase (5'-nucleotidase family)
MTVGIRDLPAGLGFLQDAAKKAGVLVLSANLKQGEKRPFPGSTVIEIDGVKVGLIGLSQPGPVPGLQNVAATPTLAAAREELKKLPADVQLKVILAATPYADAMQLAGELKGSVDLILQSGASHPTSLQPINHNYIAAAGERGRQLLQLVVKVDGAGDFENLDEAGRAKELLTRAEANLAQLNTRRQAADSEWARSQLDTTIAELSARRDELKKTVGKATARNARTIKSTAINLDAALGEDAELLKRQLVIEPPGTNKH